MKIFDHHWFCDAPIVTSPLFSVFDYMGWYPISFNVDCFHRHPTDGNELQGQGRLGERHGTAMPDQAKCWNHWGD